MTFSGALGRERNVTEKFEERSVLLPRERWLVHAGEPRVVLRNGGVLRFAEGGNSLIIR